MPLDLLRTATLLPKAQIELWTEDFDVDRLEAVAPSPALVSDSSEACLASGPEPNPLLLAPEIRCRSSSSTSAVFQTNIAPDDPLRSVSGPSPLSSLVSSDSFRANGVIPENGTAHDPSKKKLSNLEA